MSLNNWCWLYSDCYLRELVESTLLMESMHLQRHRSRNHSRNKAEYCAARKLLKIIEKRVEKYFSLVFALCVIQIAC